ncbi:MAG: cysteine--tRNA ligase [Candidatus Thermoplasmatota archaeon]
MSLKIYDSLSKEKQKFQPIEENKVNMYVCGMTVYSDAHIGHARTYYVFDVVRRYLEYKGYKVKYVQNITDVDDKIINAANEENVDPLEYSKRFSGRCLKDLDSLGIKRADVYPRASETIEDMIEMIQDIIDNGYGYEADGDVYFSVKRYEDYGKLSGQKVEEMKAGARIEPGGKKRSPLDFALWKKAKPDEPAWDSPWGKGRPGWHIECSTMSTKHLGAPFDIHGGGLDLKFPHHENEIAQAEGATGKEFARYWMHVGLLTIEGEKMSKSLGNIINIKDLLEKWDAEVVRMFFAQTQYRSPPDFSEKGLTNAKKALDRIYRVKDKLEDISNNADGSKENLSDEDKKYLEAINRFEEDFENAMDDDFNTPQAVSSIFNFVNSTNRYLQEENVKPSFCRRGLDRLLRLGGVLTLFQGLDEKEKDIGEEVVSNLQKIVEDYSDESAEEKDLDVLMDTVLQLREEARRNKKWDKADEIRDKLQEIGFEVQDTEDGPVWRKK